MTRVSLFTAFVLLGLVLAGCSADDDRSGLLAPGAGPDKGFDPPSQEFLADLSDAFASMSWQSVEFTVDCSGDFKVVQLRMPPFYYPLSVEIPANDLWRDGDRYRTFTVKVPAPGLGETPDVMPHGCSLVQIEGLPSGDFPITIGMNPIFWQQVPVDGTFRSFQLVQGDDGRYQALDTQVLYSMPPPWHEPQLRFWFGPGRDSDPVNQMANEPAKPE